MRPGERGRGEEATGVTMLKPHGKGGERGELVVICRRGLFRES